MIRIRPTRAAAIGLTAITALLVAACGGGGSTDPASPPPTPPTPQPQTDASPADGPAAAPSVADQVGPDLRVPGLAVYTLGVDLWFQRGSDASLLLEGSQRIALFTPALSPDGARVAYIRFDQAPGDVGDIGSDLHVLNMETGIDTAIRTHVREGEFYWSPVWSADGERITYSHQINRDPGDDPGAAGALFAIDIEEIDLATGDTEVLREDAAEPVLSPDGATLAFVDQPALDHILGVMDLTTGESRTLLDLSDNLSFFRVPRFSPDGGALAFLASGDGPLASAAPAGFLPAALATNGIQDLWLIRLDGSGLTRLTTVLEDTPHFSWSADGRHALVRGAFGVYLVDVATRETQTLGPGEFHGSHDWAGVLASATP